MTAKEEFSVKEISAEETYSIRHPILRAGKPLNTCAFNGDNLETTVHIGIFNKNTVIGVASFMKTSNDLFTEILQYQLRGMAVLQEFQGKELGKMLLEHGEGLLQERNIELIWCNARIIAVNFYKRNGYKITGDPFEIDEIGTHYKMYKALS